MSDEEAPKIEFPCPYPIKVIGEASVDFSEEVVRIVQYHDPELDVNTLQVMDSSKGNYMSIRLTITATGETQLKDMFEALKATGRVKMVL